MEYRQRRVHLFWWKLMAIVLPLVLLAVVVLRPEPVIKVPEQVTAPVAGAR